MSSITIVGTGLGTPLTELIDCDQIQPGSTPSYQICKTIYEYHPLGAKMVDGPINLAQSQARDIVIADDPDGRLLKAFNDEWKRLNCDNLIFNTMVLSRIYGIGSIIVGTKGADAASPLDYATLYQSDIYFNVLDPLNTSGSLVLDQDPNSPYFQKPVAVSVQGVQYNSSRACVIMHGEPIYISYTTSAFGYSGRSVYQRALYPLKTFITSMRTDDLVIRKAGVLVAMLKGTGSAVTNLMAKAAGFKRNILKEAETDNVISISIEEKIESLNLQNTDGAMKQGRTNVLENIAVAADMPAKLLNSETFAEGFGEGTEDAKMLARYIEGVRKEMDPVYAFLSTIVMYRAWTPEFFVALDNDAPGYTGVAGFDAQFAKYKNGFVATWPNLLIEPESKQVEVEKVKFDSVTKFLEMALTSFDPKNKATVLQWAADCFNDSKTMFPVPLVLDYQAMEEYTPPEQQMDNSEGADGGKTEKPAKPELVKAAA